MSIANRRRSMLYRQDMTLTKRSVQGEREDELFYQYLISIAPSREEKEIIASIRDDERKHNRIFRQISICCLRSLRMN